ncbi:MAG TPA: DNA polymerase/3'-5' exonuclease PolX [Pirellulaceae bacterium]|nr:DNA polymerase/3'-5' exonuclease PolX [Pirellulaceae bacterium]
MTNATIADAFDQIADLLDFQGANPFRVRAYRNSARTIRDYHEPLENLVVEGSKKLTQIEGIGDDLAQKIVTLVGTGELPMLMELKSQIPESVLALLRIPGLGPKKAKALYDQLAIKTLADLKAACDAHQVQKLKGFGAKTEQLILQGMEIAEKAGQRMLWAEADQIVQELRKYLRSCPSIQELEFAGSYRRGRETIGDLDILVVAQKPDEPMDCLAAFPLAAETIARGDTKMSVRTHAGLQIDLRVVPEESFGAALQYFTGSKEHNVTMRGIAKERGLKVNEYGVFRVKGEKETYIAGRTEQEVYAALDLPLFPPEIRENRREFEWAAVGKLPELIELADLRGDLHMHTFETDGSASIEEMVAAARERDLKYIAITDHSKRVTMANGLNAERLRKQWQQIDAVNKQLGKDFTLLKGIECDILESGELDLPDDVLAEADWVVCSVHYGQKQPREKITERIVGALANEHVDCIAHPTGRLIGRRDPYEVDIEAVFAAAKKHQKLLELNANPLRLDLNDVMCAAAKTHGIPIVISSDAHSTDGIDVLRYGILQARRAGLTKHDVANTRTWPQMKKLLPSHQHS